MRALLISIYLFPVMAYAEEAEKLEWWDKLPMDIGELAVKVGDFLSGPEILGVAAVLEVVFRLVKSKKPLSILIGIQKVLKGAEKVLAALNSGLDKIVPQKLDQ